jgi:diguanylate cyclase (GGDEF)-like protein
MSKRPVRAVPEHRPFRSLAGSLLRRTIGVAIACTLLAASVQVAFTVREENQRFDRALDTIAATNVPQLSLSLWDIEPEAVRRQLIQIALQPEIMRVRVRASTGQEFRAGDPGAGRSPKVRSLEIPYPDKRKGSIGTLELSPDRTSMYTRLTERIVGIVLGFATLATAVCALTYAVLRDELERPMRELARFTRELRPDRLTLPLGELRPPRAHADEIDLVADGFRTLQDGIRAHVENLDSQVAQRTSELESALDEIRALTITDALTGCFNRRYLDTRLSEEALRSRRTGQPLAVVMADIDRFKLINDTLGHPAGDAVLKSVASLFRGAMRERIDWVARFGGEEFVIVLPDTTLDAAAAVAERLRAAVEAAQVYYDGKQLEVTASFGVSVTADGSDAASLLARADELLYEAKAAGRNRVIAGATST